MSNELIAININAYTNFDRVGTKILNKIDKMQAGMKKLDKSAAKTTMGFSKLQGSLSRFAFVAIPAVVLAVRSAVKEGLRFETALRDLTAITGISGDRLKDVGQLAEKMSLQFGFAADNVVSGMKRIASNKYELIGVSGALEDVTKKAGILAAASRMTFYKSGEVITAAMNQFKLGMDQSDRIINAFASAAKYGSFEIDRLAQVMSRAGGAMDAMNLSFEDALSVAMIGSRLGLTGEMVGTQLKTGLMRLGQVDDLFNPIIHGFDNVMSYLSAAHLDPSEIMSIFGLESAQVSMALTTQLGKWKEYKKAITGTNIAYVQAAENLRSMEARMSRLKASVHDLYREWFFTEENYSKLSSFVGLLDDIFGGNKTGKSGNRHETLIKGFKDVGIVIGGVLALLAGGKIKDAFLVAKGLFGFLANTKVGEFLTGVKGSAADLLFVFIGIYELVTKVLGTLWAWKGAMKDAFSSGNILKGLGMAVGAIGSGLLKGAVAFVYTLAEGLFSIFGMIENALRLFGVLDRNGTPLFYGKDGFTAFLAKSNKETQAGIDELVTDTRVGTGTYAEQQENAKQQKRTDRLNEFYRNNEWAKWAVEHNKIDITMKVDDDGKWQIGSITEHVGDKTKVNVKTGMGLAPAM